MRSIFSGKLFCYLQAIILLTVAFDTSAELNRRVNELGQVTFSDRQPTDGISLRYKADINEPLNSEKPSGQNSRSPSSSQRINNLEDLKNLTHNFDSKILSEWLSSYSDCSNHFFRVDFKYKNYLSFFTHDGPLVIPVVKHTGNQVDLYYSTSYRFEFDTQRNVILSYVNGKNPKVLYRCDEQQIPKRYVNNYYKYLINQSFINGHSLGDNIEVNDGIRFLQQECRADYQSKKYKKARTTCGLASVHDKNHAARYYLGMLYRFNWGGKIDLHKSYKYTLESANKGFSPAFGWLAWHYDFGKGIEPDYAEALRWRIAAVDAGHLEAAKSIAKYYLQGKAVEQDYSQAVVWLVIAAKTGDSHAQNMLGCMYANGIGIQQNYFHAIYWIRKSEKTGNPKAIFNLAVLYANNIVPNKGVADSVPLFDKANRFGIYKSSDINNIYDRLWHVSNTF